MDAAELARKKHRDFVAAQKKAKKDKRERIKAVLLKNIERGNCANTNIPGYALDEAQNVVKV